VFVLGQKSSDLRGSSGQRFGSREANVLLASEWLLLGRNSDSATEAGVTGFGANCHSLKHL
jgi:hypothetical protein